MQSQNYVVTSASELTRVRILVHNYQPCLLCNLGPGGRVIYTKQSKFKGLKTRIFFVSNHPRMFTLFSDPCFLPTDLTGLRFPYFP